ncbi:hypothetical protein D9758_014722 [Tetrapyrgos nigripes]|uniref:RZ-type domain-containing protein n=1 Tax=Tetrapyrgos nigripes TaxID=182062 RepID=A0A8H5CAJ6_9AGAR|nr:hypothetical protein D9758_014722 [Tetrapyrgos nigripes]
MSLCGEDCSIQICPVCAPPERQNDVVDLLLYLKLEDILVDEETLENLLITLPNCGHVFTVETLDGICHMNDYYTKRVIQPGGLEVWSGLKSPDRDGIAPPPVCPTCRSAITSPRYGRTFKRANLDILERNVISDMTQRLDVIQVDLSGVSQSNLEAELVQSAGKAVFDSSPLTEKNRKLMLRKRASVLRDQNGPVSINELLPTNLALFHISKDVSTKWLKITTRLTGIYSKVVEVTKVRSPHITAWEGAFSYLYEQELKAYGEDPSHLPAHPEQNAMHVARIRVGQPQPQADRRFSVEAIWMTLRIRFILVSLANAFRKEAAQRENEYPVEEHRQWASFTIFVLDTCIKDAELAVERSTQSGARRQITVSMLLAMRANLERFRFNMEMKQTSGMLKDLDVRNELFKQAHEEAEVLKNDISTVTRAHLSRLPDDRREWLPTNFVDGAGMILGEWKEIARSLKSETFYEPVSLDEKISIVRAFNFSHTGHFYTCRNGHVFVIGECGGAMQASRCPECGEPVGGSSHRLDNTNRQALDFEDIARDQGAQRSPWNW